VPTFTLLLRCIAPLILIVSALHLALGLGAESLLGANVSPDTRLDPALDSQNRFYGVAFALYGVLLFVCAGDVPKYATILRCLLWTFFAAGVARLVSIATHGAPPPMVIALLASELLTPPLLLWWLSKLLKKSA
jgi:hypothetical protein